MLFKILWVINAIAALIIVYFFFEGISDGSVSGFNIGLWLLIIGALAVILIGSILLRSNGHSKMGIALLFIMAIPVVLFVLYFAVAILTNQRWN